MATTTNFGWETPDDTDLVKDGAAAIRTLGGAIDTSLVDLKGGTTGQILSKASNTDMDFTWTADASGIPATLLDAKGDLIVASAADTAARLAVGTDGHILTADSTATNGIKWAAATSAGSNFSLLNAGGTSLTGASTITISSISGYDTYFVLVNAASSDVASGNFGITLNGDTTGYGYFGQANTAGGTYNNADYTVYQSTSASAFRIVQMSGSASSEASFGVAILGGKTTGMKMLFGTGGATSGGSNSQIYRTALGYSDAGGSAISSISITNSSGNFDGGTVRIYGA